MLLDAVLYQLGGVAQPADVPRTIASPPAIVPSGDERGFESHLAKVAASGTATFAVSSTLMPPQPMGAYEGLKTSSVVIAIAV